MADIRISRLYLIKICPKVACSISFSTFLGSRISVLHTHTNVIDATCKEIVIHQQMVTIATDKQHCTLRIHTCTQHVTDTHYSKIHFIHPLVFYRDLNGDICDMMPLINDYTAFDKHSACGQLDTCRVDSCELTLVNSTHGQLDTG